MTTDDKTITKTQAGPAVEMARAAIPMPARPRSPLEKRVEALEGAVDLLRAPRKCDSIAAERDHALATLRQIRKRFGFAGDGSHLLRAFIRDRHPEMKERDDD